MEQMFKYNDVTYTMTAEWLKYENDCDVWECRFLAVHHLDGHHKGEMTVTFYQGSVFKGKEPNIMLVLKSLADNASAYEFSYACNYETFLEECLFDDDAHSQKEWDDLEKQVEDFNNELLPSSVTPCEMYNEFKEFIEDDKKYDENSR